MSTAALGVGLVVLGMFLIVKTGLIKSWFVLETLPGLLSARMIYAALPLGIGFLILAFAPLAPSYDPRDWNIWLNVFMLSPFVGFAFMIWPPAWIKPGWLQWLEREYGYCLDILVEEAQKMNRWDWESRVRTRKGMQAWIDQIFTRRQQEIDQLWVEMRSYLLWAQVDAEGRRRVEWGERIKGYVPEHRQKEEEERIRRELEKPARIRK